MKEIVIHAGFHPEVQRVYHGEHIYKVLRERRIGEDRDFHSEAVLPGHRFYLLDNGAWIKDLSDDKYETDWTGEERWGRAEELETDGEGRVLSSRTLGFILLRVDRDKGLL